jgi:hypothetical protein
MNVLPGFKTITVAIFLNSSWSIVATDVLELSIWIRALHVVPTSNLNWLFVSDKIKIILYILINI